MDEPTLENEEPKLTSKITAYKTNGYVHYVPMLELFALFSEARSEAARVGIEANILDYIEAKLRKLL